MSAVTALADELLAAFNEQQPLLATLSGFREHDHRLADHSEAGETAAAAHLTDIVGRSRALDPTVLSAGDRLTRAVIDAHAEATAPTAATSRCGDLARPSTGPSTMRPSQPSGTG